MRTEPNRSRGVLPTVTVLRAVVLVVGGAALGACNDDPCQSLADEIVACPGYVDPGTPEPKACNDTQKAEAQCILDSGLDICVVAFHPEQLTPAQVKTRDACASSK